MRTLQPAPAQAAAARPNRWRNDRVFYAAYTLAAIATVLAGFGPTYYFKGSHGAALVPLVQLHAALFTTWIALFAVQVFLVTKRRTDIHRRLGIFGIVVAAAILVAGFTTAIAGARTGW